MFVKRKPGLPTIKSPITASWEKKNKKFAFRIIPVDVQKLKERHRRMQSYMRTLAADAMELEQNKVVNLLDVDPSDDVKTDSDCIFVREVRLPDCMFMRTVKRKPSPPSSNDCEIVKETQLEPCCICYDAWPNVKTPCGHNSMCKECFENLLQSPLPTKCPLCRADI
jgi:hypothetical protein